MYGGEATRAYVSWCPSCFVWCDFDDEDVADRLTENHNDNFHDGEPVSTVRYNTGTEHGGTQQ